jgi:hypothetical protein
VLDLQSIDLQIWLPPCLGVANWPMASRWTGSGQPPVRADASVLPKSCNRCRIQPLRRRCGCDFSNW